MKKWWEVLATAWVGVATHKLRSFLTILGIVIGVAAVITLMSIGKGVEARIVSNIESLGSNLIIIRPGAVTAAGGVRGAFGGVQTLTLEDATAISLTASDVTTVAPFSSSSMQVVAGNQNMRAAITGITPDYIQAYNLQIASGSFFSNYDYDAGTKVAVLGASVTETLFTGSDPVGQQVRMGNNVVRVIGVLESKGATMGSADDTILMPLSTLQQMVSQPRTSRGEHIVSSITLAVTDQAQTSSVIDQITSLLRARHQITTGGDNDFTVTSMEELASTLSEAIGTMTLLLGAIAAISLLVGGIGVMNIMLVSVVERTREIGILKALGARERDIWGQFLVEAIFLTLTGGIIGVALGWAASSLVSRLDIIPTLVSADIVVLAVSVSIAIGLFFGFYPAWNGSRLDPIEALRSQ
ncbi:MAG: ABC transporter permease [Dehalococcoidales bacterium]|nr:ABC transporter permease [Dehalococcoidales bacterium]